MDTNGHKPTVISTFAGTGGSSLGYKWAGYKELLAIDWEDHAVECFKANFPEVPVWHRDITKVTSQEILDFCKIKVGELDVFDGSPPCQGFSTAGKREVSDSRNDLFNHYCRLVNELQPKVFVMENVSGMIKGTMKGKFIEIMTTLKSMNYNVKCKLMNSMYYGVPQSRQRTIFIGVRKDLNKFPEFPIPSNKITSAYSEIKKVNDIGLTRDVFPFIKKVIHKMRPGESVSKYHPTGAGYSMGRLSMNGPCGTILKQAGNMTLHPLENRELGLNEYKVICSFPETWILGDKITLGIERLGNSVMPKFMQAIATTIKEKLLINNS